MTSNKSKRKTRDNKRTEAIKIVADKFSVTKELVRMVINNPSYDYGKASDIRKAYSKTYNQLTQILA